MDVPTAQEFVRANHHAVLATIRTDGRPQLSPVAATVDIEGRVVVSTRETALKVKHLRRDPRIGLTVFTDSFFGEWVQLEGTAEIVSLPEAMEPLVEYYRSTAGDHPDWDEYRAAMLAEKRVIVRFVIERAGPNVSG